MINKKINIYMILFTVLAAVITATPALAWGKSANVAVVDDYYSYQMGSIYPSDYPNQTFSVLTPSNLSASTLANKDTLFLWAFNPSLLSSAQKSAINSWIYSGGKLIIWDAEEPYGTAGGWDYTWLPYPFSTSVPGAQGAYGQGLSIVEENPLSSAITTSPYYIDTNSLNNYSDAIGDSNVFTSYSTSWCVDMKAKNYLGVQGPNHVYAKYGSGLIIYSGLDWDYAGMLGSGWPTSWTGLNTGNSPGYWIKKLFKQELEVSGNLPCGVIQTGTPTLQVTKTADKSSANIGDSITFTITVTNTGNDTAYNVNLTDILPVELSTTGSTIFSLGNMAPGTSATRTLTATVVGTPTTLFISPSYAPGEQNTVKKITNGKQAISAASASSAIVVTANPLWTDTGLIINNGNIVSITASGTWNGGFGGDVGPDGGTPCCTYDMFLVNPTTLQGELIAFVGSDPYQGQWGNGSFFPQTTGYWGIGSSGSFVSNKSGKLWLGFNDDAVSQGVGDNSGSVAALVTVNTVNSGTSGCINNIANAVGRDSQQNIVAGSGKVSICIGGVGGAGTPSLHVTKTADKSSANIGDTIIFTITVANSGNATAYNVNLTDTLPAELSTTGSTTFSLGNMAAGTSATRTLTATVVGMPATSFVSPFYAPGEPSKRNPQEASTAAYAPGEPNTVSTIINPNDGLAKKASTAAYAPSAPFKTGDVFAGVNNGNVQHYDGNGNLLETLNTGSGSYTTGMAFDLSGNLYVTTFSSNTVAKFNNMGVSLGSFGSGYSSPESILFDSIGNVYVGNLYNGIRKFDSNGNFLETVYTSRTDWMDLSKDQCTMLITSEGTTIKRYNVCTKTPLSDFATGLTNAYALRILSDGSVLVADKDNIKRFNSGGTLIQTYDATGQNGWFALNLDPDGSSFWSGDYGNDKFFKFDISTGNILKTIDTGKGGGNLYGLVVFGEITASTTPVLKVTKTVDKSNANVGDSITFTVTVTNTGNDTANNVNLTDSLPAELSTTGSTIFSLGNMAPGTSATRTVTATVVSAPTTSSSVTNIANAVGRDSNQNIVAGSGTVSVTISSGTGLKYITNIANAVGRDSNQNIIAGSGSVTITIGSGGVSTACKPAGYAFDGNLKTADLNSGLTPTDLVNTLLGGGVAISNITYSGAKIAAGNFSNAAGIIGFDSGIILSSGNICSVVGPNTSPGTSTDNGKGGDTDLGNLIPGYTTYDAAVLEFDFVPTSSLVTFQYVFGSEEYNEYVNTKYNDVFGFFVNGVDVALVPGTGTAVSINNLNGGNPYGTNASNPAFFLNNENGTIDTELDGLTVVLTATANVNPGKKNHVKLAIADAGDYVLDSDVFIKATSFSAPKLTLEPLTATNMLGSSHTLTAKLVDANGNGKPGQTINFNVIAGPNAGLTGTGVTNSGGQATFSYTGTTAGTDTIVATSGVETSNKVFKTWSAGGGTTVSIADATAITNSNVSLPIVVENVTNLGAGTVWLTYDPSVVNVLSVSAGDLGTVVANINNTIGRAAITAFSTTPASGNVTFSNVLLRAVGAMNTTSSLMLSVIHLADQNGVAIQNTVRSGTFKVSSTGVLKGDVNGDGQINVVDALFVAQYTVGLRQLNSNQLAAADVNCDVQVTVVDALFIAQYTVGLRATFC